MRIKYREAEQVVTKLRLEPAGKKRHNQYKFVFNGVYVLRTRFSHGAGEMRATDKFRTQLKLNENQLKGVIQCTFEYEDYVALLKQKGLIPD